MNQEQFNQFVCEFSYQIIKHNSTVSDQENYLLIRQAIAAGKYYLPIEIRPMIDAAIVELTKR